MTNDYEVAVIGRGMIGAAAARHLAESDTTVVLIGSGEPADYTNAAGPFASHYDQGRITRISSASEVWAELAARSIARYGDIAARSGVSFHEPRGLAQTSSDTQASIDNALARGGNAHRVDREWLRKTTGIAVRESHPGEIFYEGAPAGVIDPRRLVAAQTLLAQRAGAHIVDAPATKIHSRRRGVSIDCGTAVSADQVLLATGAYGASLAGVDLAIERRLRTIVLAELGAGVEIPTYIDDAPEHDDLDEIYWVPPLLFPDGRTMLKIGGNSLPLIAAESDNDITAWFRAGGSEAETLPFQDTIRSLLPDATITSWDHKPCVVTYTDAELPYIGQVDDRIIVALGASGSGAKSSDELGRLAAALTRSAGWTDSVLDAEQFHPRLRSESSIRPPE